MSPRVISPRCGTGKGTKGPDFTHEAVLIGRGTLPVAGVDEAGRGPLAGPVVAAAVILPEGFDPATDDKGLRGYGGLGGLNDSKKLTASKRESLFLLITSHPEIRWAVAEASSGEIGELNILRATHLAMRRALLLLGEQGHPPAHALIDGLPAKGIPVPHTALVGGDGLSLSIAAASIVAKVTRDRMMDELDREFPLYGFSRHRGYPTADHLATLREHGPCPHHRRGFAPVDQASLLL